MNAMTDLHTLGGNSVTTEDRVLSSTCVCGAKLRTTVPAGTTVSVARFMERLVSNGKCDECFAADERAEELREQARLRRQRLETSGLPRGLQGLTWDSYELTARGAAQAVAAARAWAEGTASKPGLLLCGPVGVGKTRLAATASWELLRHRGLRWVSVPELVTRLGASFGDAERAQAIKVLTGKGALVLDDLDKIKPSTWVLQNLFTAIDSRYQAGAPLFVTTNLLPSELVAYFVGEGRDREERRVAAEAIVSRLVEHCRSGKIDGADRRRA